MYQYKIVLTCAGASWFRSGDLDSALDLLKKVDIKQNQLDTNRYIRTTAIKTKEELDYAFKLQKLLAKMSDFEIRVESPWISIYTNSKSDIDALIKLDKEKVKYYSVPPANAPLDVGTVIMPKMNYDYRITLGKTSHNCLAFIEWAEGNAKLKLTKSCKRDLSKERSWGGTHFYVTGDKNLLMTRMHLGGSISKVERILKAINTR
jgi:hypothetical protein